MKRLILAVIPLALAACGGGSDIQEAQGAQSYNVSCSTAPASISCQATPAGGSSTPVLPPEKRGNTQTGVGTVSSSTS